MDATALEHWILQNYPGVLVAEVYRERSFFYNPDGSLPKGMYLATIKESDGPNDKASHLDRVGIYRVSIGIGKKHFQHIFGPVPQRPAKGEIVNLDVDFKAPGVLMPHPIYAWLGWVFINNPTDQDLDLLQQLLDISYQNVLAKFAKKR